MPSTVPRVLPTVEGLSAFFWTSGADGKLRFLQCDSCSYFVHPPTDYCPRCQGRSMEPTAVSGRGTVYSFTVNHQAWDGVGDVYTIGLVELAEQDDLRLVTNIVGVEPSEVYIGMPVQVSFEDHSPVYLPIFAPVTS
jgi:uncharacterized protein